MIEEQGGTTSRRPSPQPPPSQPLGLRGVLLATAVAVILTSGLAGTAIATSHGRTHAAPAAATSLARPASRPDATPKPFPTADPATLAPLRTAAPSSPDAVIDDTDATRLLSAFWPAREEALSHRDPAAVRALENGAAGEWDAVGCTMGCAPPSPRPINDVRFFIPQQNAYPADFMAQVLTTSFHSASAMVEIMVFTRQAAGQPWFLSFDTVYTGLDSLRESPIDYRGFDAVPADDTSLDRTALPGMLASYWRQWGETGAAPADTPFYEGPFTSDHGMNLAKSIETLRAQGINHKETFSADPTHDGVWSFAVNLRSADGHLHEDLVTTCGTVRYRIIESPTQPGATLKQSNTYKPYGTLLAPGDYSSIIFSGVIQSCEITHVGDRHILVEGTNGKQTRMEGVAAPPGAPSV
jgi:hypothetical protein